MLYRHSAHYRKQIPESRLWESPKQSQWLVRGNKAMVVCKPTTMHTHGRNKSVWLPMTTKQTQTVTLDILAIAFKVSCLTHISNWSCSYLIRPFPRPQTRRAGLDISIIQSSQIFTAITLKKKWKVWGGTSEKYVGLIHVTERHRSTLKPPIQKRQTFSWILSFTHSYTNLWHFTSQGTVVILLFTEYLLLFKCIFTYVSDLVHSPECLLHHQKAGINLFSCALYLKQIVFGCILVYQGFCLMENLV